MVATAPQLRGYQDKAANEIRDAFRQGYKSPLLVASTGWGKTVLFSYISANAAAKQGKPLILVHRWELMKQASNTLTKFGVRHGLIHADFTPDFTAPVQIASVQTLANRLHYSNLFQPTLTIIDEAHHAAAKTWGKIFDAFPSLKLGVTATPCRRDGKGLDDVFDTLVLGAGMQDLIQMGNLVQPVYYCPSVMDLSGVDTQAGEYITSQLEKVVDKPTITGDAVAHYRKLADGLPAVAFCVSRKHAEHVAQQFREAGYSAYAVDGMTDDKERERILSGLANGTVQVVTSCDLISEGFDVPDIECGIMLCPTKSLSKYIQQGGRILRPKAGKRRAILIDHAGNVFRHGLLEEPREWSLAGEEKTAGKKKAAAATVALKQCTACYAVFKPALACPECGTPIQTKGRELKQVDGVLVELDKEALKRKKEAENLQQKKEIWGAKNLDDLITIEKSRGYKKGWAEHIWTARISKQLKRG
jgi:superfamily II DNA or RNA helicase